MGLAVGRPLQLWGQSSGDFGIKTSLVVPHNGSPLSLRYAILPTQGEYTHIEKNLGQNFKKNHIAI